MANQVTDNRTLIADGTAVSNWEDIGATAGVVDTEISYDTYSGSIGEYCTTTRAGTFYNNTTTGLFTSGDHAYILFNCGIVSLLDTKANGGVTIRVTGATATDWAEFNIAGSDDYPPAFDGGWVQFVVDIDELLANPSATNGTPPTVGNIQRFGITFITATVMPRMADNCWVGGFFRLPANTPAIIVEGRDGGTTDWNLASMAAVAGVQLSAVLKPGPGGSYVCRGPIQFGINDTTTHGFSETNKTLLWDSQQVMLDGFYGLSALGNSGGTTRVNFGIKSGTGNAATGAQGGSIQAESTAARWFMDFDDPNIDDIGFWGCSLIHGEDFQLDDAAVDIASTLFIDCNSATVSGAKLVRCSVIDPNTADGVAFMITDDMADIAFSSFEFSDGHAIEINSATPTTQTNVGNLFSGFTNTVNSTDAAILNSAAGALTISSSDGSDLQTNSYRNTGGGSVTVQNNVSVTFDGLQTNTEVRIYTAGTSTELDGIENSGTSFTSSLAAATSVDYVLHSEIYEYIRVEGFTWPSSTTTIPIQQKIDRNYSNP